MSILVFLNGSVTSKSDFYDSLEIEEVIAVDGGLDKIPENIKVNKLIGDLDSVLGDYDNLEIIKYPREKDKSDFEITLDYLSTNYCDKDIIIFGLTGGRIDHQLFNFFVLKNHLNNNNYIADTDNEIIYFTDRSIEISNYNTKTFSVFPLTPMTNLTINGAYYPLTKREVNLYDSLTLSNTISSDTLTVSFDGGCAAIIINK